MADDAKKTGTQLPEQMTVYHGTNDSAKNTIGNGDFVTLDENYAKSRYKNVIKEKVSADKLVIPPDSTAETIDEYIVKRETSESSTKYKAKFEQSIINVKNRGGKVAASKYAQDLLTERNKLSPGTVEYKRVDALYKSANQDILNYEDSVQKDLATTKYRLPKEQQSVLDDQRDVIVSKMMELSSSDFKVNKNGQVDLDAFGEWEDLNKVFESGKDTQAA